MSTRAIFTLGLLLNGSAWAGEINIPVPMDYRLIRNVLVSQLFTREDATARVWKDGKECSFLDLSNPQIAGEDGQVKINNHLHARFGTKLGNKCMTLVEWSGVLETLQQPTLDDSGTVLSFPITRATALDNKGQAVQISQLQELIKQVAEPKLAELKLDLNQSRDDIVKTLLPYVSANDSEQLHDAVNSLRFNEVKANKTGIQLELGFTSDLSKAGNIEQQTALSDAELQQWRQLWQGWQQQLQQNFDNAGLSPELKSNRNTLLQLLNDANKAFEHGLTGDISDNDPVRKFFNQSWDKLGPLLRTASKQLPGAEGLRYLTLIAATDLLHEIENITAPFGLEISSNGLRKLARSLISHPNS